MDTKYHLMPRDQNFKLMVLTTKNRLIPECDFITRMLLKTFIDIMLVTWLFYVFAFLFYMYRLLFAVILAQSDIHTSI